MPDDTTIPAAAPTPAAAPVAAPAIGGMAQPGPNAAPPAATPDSTAQTQAAGFEAKSQAAYQKASDLANTPVTPPNVPHARLMNMIQGLGIGLSAFGTAGATGGREGGAKEVEQIRGEQQQQKIQAQQAAEAQKNTQIQQQLMVGDTNHKMGQNVLLLAQLPDLMKESHLKVAGEAQAQAITGADFAATHGGMDPDTFTTRISDKTPASGKTDAAGSWFKTNAQQQLDNATKILGADDPYIKQLQTTLANPQATAGDLYNATTRVQAQQKQQSDVQKQIAEKDTAMANSPVGKLSTPEALAAPGSQAAIQAKIDDPATAPTDVARLKTLLPRAAMAQKNVADLDAAKERMKQLITDGDPKAAGSLLQSGLVSPQELISSRKPQFAQAAFDEAIRLGGGTKGADGKWTGGTWSAVKAESQYEYAKNPKTQNTLNLLATMQAPGGSIDIAKKEFDGISGKVDEKTFNKILTGGITEFGGKSVTNFQAAMTSLADEYAQVLQGGAATETTLKQAKDLIQAAYTQNQGAGAFDVIQRDMAARQKGMIRDNPALNTMYPQPGSASVTPEVGKAHPVIVDGKQVGVTRDGGKTMTAN